MKRILVVLILVLTLALFTACKNGGNDVTPTEEPTNAPTATPEVTVEPTATPVPGPMTYFDSDFSDDTADEAPILDGWNFLDVTNGGNSKVQAEGDNNYFVISGFINMTFSELIEKGYTFSFDAKGIHANDVAAAFVRGNSQLTIPVSTNPNGANYYEADDSGTKFTSQQV